MSETPLPKMVRVHERTVQEAERHAAEYRPRRQRKPTKTLEGRRVKVHPEVWKTALRLAEGDPRRIKVMSAVEVLVTNGHPA